MNSIGQSAGLHLMVQRAAERQVHGGKLEQAVRAGLHRESCIDIRPPGS
jgi:hypothetical protein